MRKLTLALGLVVAMSAVAGCRAGVNDITGAAEGLEAAEKGSALRLAIGEVLIYLTSDSRTVQTGQIETDGTFGADSTDAQTTETKDVTVQKVMKTTYVESADVNGFVINEVAQETNNIWKQGNTTVDSGESIPSRDEFVMYEDRGWVRNIKQGGSDQDIYEGSAEYPVSPRPGLYYVNDQGSTHEVLNETEVVAGIKGVKVVSQMSDLPLPIEEFFNYCYQSVAAASTTPGNVDVQPVPEHNCFGGGGIFGGGPNVVFTIDAMVYSYIGRQLQLMGMMTGESIRINQIHCGNNRATPWDSAGIGGTLFDCAAGDEVYFTGEKTTFEAKTELAKTPEVASELEALPQIDDAADVLE